MNKTIRKLINNNCSIQDSAIIIKYIEAILNRNRKAIKMLEEEIPFNHEQVGRIFDVIKILKGEEQE